MLFAPAIGMAVVSGLMSGAAAAQKGVNEARRLKAQNRARIKQLQDQFALSTENLHNNNVSIKQNKMKNDVLIEENKLEAQDMFAQAFAGSGVSGRSKDVLAATLQSNVAKSHNEAGRIAQQETDRQFLGLMRQSDSVTKAIDNLPMFDSGANSANINMAAISAGVSTFAGSYTGDFGLSGSSSGGGSGGTKAFNDFGGRGDFNRNNTGILPA